MESASLSSAAMPEGRVVAIHVFERGGGPPRALERVEAEAGQGLAGDRYLRAAGRGTFFDPDKDGQDLTLIELEALEALRDHHGIELEPADARRNVVTSGIDLNALVGRRFRVGPVECLGVRLCDPCSHLERMTEKGVLRGLVERGGLRADLLTSGVIEVGDRVVPVDA
jgi:MOSC domain-containing protein YiiM